MLIEEEVNVEESTLEEAPFMEEGESTEVTESTGEVAPADVDAAPELPEKYSERVQKRINKEVAKRHEAESRAAFAEGRLAEVEKKPPPPERPIEGTEAKPKEEDFENYDDYVIALTDWRTDQKREVWRQEDERKAEEARLTDSQRSYDEKMRAGYEKYEDFHEKVFAPTNPINHVMADIIEGSDIPHEVAYYLGSHIAECAAISRMPTTQAARSIGAIEEKLRAALPASPQPKLKSGAPEPIKPVGGSEVVTKDPEKMTQEEYNRYREEQRNRR